MLSKLTGSIESFQKGRTNMKKYIGAEDWALVGDFDDVTLVEEYTLLYLDPKPHRL
jgi:hypothetical protein